MFAIVAQRHNSGEDEGMVLLATARTLKAIQRKWQVVMGQEADQAWRRRPARYEYVGILTPEGLVNFRGAPIGPIGGERVVARMEIDYV